VALDKGQAVVQAPQLHRKQAVVRLKLEQLFVRRPLRLEGGPYSSIKRAETFTKYLLSVAIGRQTDPVPERPKNSHRGHTSSWIAVIAKSSMACRRGVKSASLPCSLVCACFSSCSQHTYTCQPSSLTMSR
jgi:hypothetical protein